MANIKKYKTISPELLKMATLQNKETSDLRSSVNSFVEAVEHYQISVDKLIPYHKQARKYFDENEIENLAKSIKEHGIRQPLTIIQSGDGINYEVVSGERRLRAAKVTGLKKIPCIIITDTLLAEEIALVENIQRQDLHPIEQGEAFLKILNSRKGMSQLELSERLGLSNKVVSEIIQYTKLPQSVKDIVVSHNISGRDYLRKLVKSEDPMSLIAKPKDPNKGKKSIIRILLDNGDFHVQFNPINKINDEQKLSLKNLLIKLSQEI